MIETIPKLIEHASHSFGDKAFLYEKNDSGWHGYSFSQVAQISRSMALFYSHKNFKKNVSIIAEGRPSWIMCEYGLSMIGAVSVPLSIKLTPNEITFRLEHAEIELVICSRFTIDKVLESLGKLHEKVSLIFLDKDEESISKILSSGSFVRGTNFWLFDEALEIGAGLLSSDHEKARLEELEASVGPETLASICYSSGTTGNPKGVMLSHKNYLQDAYFSLERFPFPYGNSSLVVLPIDHCFAHTVYLYVGMMRSMPLYFVDARGGSMGILRNIPINLKEVKPDFMLTVPAILQNFKAKIEAGIEKKGGLASFLFKSGLSAKIRANRNVFQKAPLLARFFLWFGWALPELLVFSKIRKELGKLGFAINGGAALDIKVQEWFKAIGIPVYQGYGLSEASPVISTNVWYAHKLGSSGMPLPGLSIEIRNEAGKVLEPGLKGEICVKADTVMQGYYKNPETTAQTIVGGWLKTGDLGYVDANGFLFVLGRAKALLIAEDGEKYSPEDIENAIVSCSRFIQHCVLWCDHKKFTSAIISLRLEELKEFAKQSHKDIDELIDELKKDFNAYTQDKSYGNLFLRQWLPASFMIASSPFSETDGTINSTLKVVRHKVVDQYQDLIDFQYNQGFSQKNDKIRATLKESLGI